MVNQKLLSEQLRLKMNPHHMIQEFNCAIISTILNYCNDQEAEIKAHLIVFIRQKRSGVRHAL